MPKGDQQRFRVARVRVYRCVLSEKDAGGSTAQLLHTYDAQMRAEPPSEAGQRIERADGVVRTRGGYNTILFCDIDAASVRQAVAQQAAYFGDCGVNLEWKVFSHDATPGLTAALSAQGFECGERETLMMLPLRAKEFAATRGADVAVRPVLTSRDLATYVDRRRARRSRPLGIAARARFRKLMGRGNASRISETRSVSRARSRSRARCP